MVGYQTGKHFSITTELASDRGDTGHNDYPVLFGSFKLKVQVRIPLACVETAENVKAVM